MILNDSYWRKFYSKPHPELAAPSPFAQWAAQYLHNRVILDLGCGNGRDTLFLAHANPNIFGVDLYAPPNEKYFRRESIESFLRFNPLVPQIPNSVVYCRFLFHAIDRNLQQRIVKWAAQAGATLYVEARTNLDKPVNPDHKRRLIDGQKFLASLMRDGFRILHYEEGFGRARFGDEDPHVLRVVAKGGG
jgi:SAM-dependent methyltransferase